MSPFAAYVYATATKKKRGRRRIRKRRGEKKLTINLPLSFVPSTINHTLFREPASAALTGERKFEPAGKEVQLNWKKK